MKVTRIRKSKPRFLLAAVLSIISFLFFSASPVSAALIINEFSSASTTEWVELLNTDQVNSVSLTNYEIRNNSATTLKTLSGKVPRSGMLTFEFPAASLTNAGDCLFLWNGTSNISSISYGTGTCTGGTNPGLAAPGSTETGALINSSWAIDTTPSRGWCNDATGGCPTIATIVSSMNSFGVKTNLDSFADYSRTSGLYFQKSESNDPNGNPIGKITFLSEINFTDKDALTFLQNLGSKIDMSTKGTVGLDADLIKDLVSTNAALTMYGLTLANPKVQVNGADDTAGVASGITYSGGTLTFTAAHFTTFKAVENSSSSSSSSNSSSAPSCNDSKPTGTPNLFQIDTLVNQAVLYFAPVSGSVSKYYIAYGYTPGDQRFGVEFNQGKSGGALSYSINSLSSNATYYFRVRGGNGCMPGSWGNEMKITTAKKGTTGGIQYYKDFPSRISSISQQVSVLGAATSLKEDSNTTSTNKCEYSVKSGDSLWGIAASQFGSGTKYKDIIEKNKDTYPTLLQNTLLRIGWKLRIDC